MHSRMILSSIALLGGLLLPAVVARSSDVPSVRVVGQVGGITQAVVADGSLCYYPTGSTLCCARLNSNGTTTLLGRTPPLSQTIRGVAIGRGLAAGRDVVVAVAGEIGLAVADTTNPVEPSWLSSVMTQGTAEDVAVDGQYAYVANGSLGLAVYDIADPAAPKLVAEMDTPNWGHDVACNNGFVYLANDGGGLWIFDAYDPTNPAKIAEVPAPSGADFWGVAVTDDRAYVAMAGAGIMIVDLTTLPTPTVVATLDTPGAASKCAIQGDYLYVADSWTGVQVVDVSAETTPKVVANLDTDGYSSDLWVQGDRLFLTENEGGLAVLDISAPTVPRLLQRDERGAWGVGLTKRGDLVFTAGGGIAGLQAYDVADPSNPRLVATIPTGGDPRDVVVTDQYAFVANGSTGLTVIDISTVTAARLVKSFGGIGYARRIARDADLVYLVSEEFGLAAFDISDPLSPASLQLGYDTPQVASGVAVDGRFIYVADRVGGVERFMRTENALELDYQYQDGDDMRSVCVAEGRLYGAKGWNGLAILEGPADGRIVQLGALKISGAYAYDVAARDQRAYVAGGGGGLSVVDVSAPEAPVLLAATRTSDARAVLVEGDYAYLADGPGGLLVLEVSDFAAPSADPEPSADPAPEPLPQFGLCGIGLGLPIAAGLVGCFFLRGNCRRYSRPRHSQQHPAS